MCKPILDISRPWFLGGVWYYVKGLNLFRDSSLFEHSHSGDPSVFFCHFWQWSTNAFLRGWKSVSMKSITTWPNMAGWEIHSISGGFSQWENHLCWYISIYFINFHYISIKKHGGFIYKWGIVQQRFSISIFQVSEVSKICTSKQRSSQIENHIGYRSKMPLVASFSEAKRFGVHDDPCGLV